MSYSARNPAWDRLQRTLSQERHNEEASLMNALQREVPGMSRDDAAREAARIVQGRKPAR